MLLITGATGQLGQALFPFLLARWPASQLAALVRDPAKATHLRDTGVSIRVGNYDDPAALDAAMVGVERVLLIAGTDEHKRVAQHGQVIDAARRAGVTTVAYTSRALRDRTTLANPLMEGHFQTEDLLLASGLRCVLFRNSLYLDAIPLFVGPAVLDTGIQLPAGAGQVAFALRSELAEAMATVLTDPIPVSRTYTLTGDTAYSFADVAAALQQLSGRPVRYTPATVAVFEALLTTRGVPAAGIDRIVGFMTDIANGQEAGVTTELSQLLGRPTASLPVGLRPWYGH